MSGILDDIASLQKSNRRRAVTLLLVVALVSLSVLSGYLYLRMDEYHDAKYRSQSVIMHELSSNSALASYDVATVANTSIPVPERALAGTSAHHELTFLSRLALSIREMYLDDSEKNATFAGVFDAVSMYDAGVTSINVFLIWNVTNGWAMTEMPNVTARLSTAAPLLLDLSRALESGFKSDVDFEKHPYSVVARLDLGSIRDISDSMINTLSGMGD